MWIYISVPLWELFIFLPTTYYSRDVHSICSIYLVIFVVNFYNSALPYSLRYLQQDIRISCPEAL
jgi:hypothetical protein